MLETITEVDFDKSENAQLAEGESTAPKTKVWFESRAIAKDVEGTILFQNALSLIEEKEYDFAENLLRTLLLRNSKSPLVIYWMLQCALRQNNMAHAEKLSQILLSIKKDFYTYYMLANILYQRGDEAEAKKNYLAALDFETDDEDALFEVHKNLGNIEVKWRDFESAEEHYALAYKCKKKSDSLSVNLGTLEIQRGELDVALSRFRRALQLNDQNDKAWVGLALIHYQFSDAELAWANVSRSLDINPTNKTAIQLCIDWATTEQKLNLTKQRLVNFLAVEGLDADVSLALAKIFIYQKDYESASVELERSYAINPNFPEIVELRKTINRLRKSK